MEIKSRMTNEKYLKYLSAVESHQEKVRKISEDLEANFVLRQKLEEKILRAIVNNKSTKELQNQIDVANDRCKKLELCKKAYDSVGNNISELEELKREAHRELELKRNFVNEQFENLKEKFAQMTNEWLETVELAASMRNESRSCVQKLNDLGVTKGRYYASAGDYLEVADGNYDGFIYLSNKQVRDKFRKRGTK